MISSLFPISLGALPVLTAVILKLTRNTCQESDSASWEVADRHGARMHTTARRRRNRRLPKLITPDLLTELHA
jgi:hypothetical protein